jgi:hypothetical protein
MKFLNNGVEECGIIYNKKDCSKLIKEIHKTRNFKSLFLSFKNWKSKKYQIIKNNPAPGRNLLHKLEISFIFENKKFIKILSKILGINYKILDAKLVMGVPKHMIPKWVLNQTNNNHTVNLGQFIKPKFRDITYFRGIDFHQDIIDFPTRGADFITAYIYLEDVDLKSAPLHIIPNSHLLGADYYPHKIKKTKNKKLIYKVKKKKMELNPKTLKGFAGSLFFWHPFILHGTQPLQKDIARISVRILAEKNRRINIGCDLDKINNKIKGKKKLKIYNKEINKYGQNIKKNFINKLN